MRTQTFGIHTSISGHYINVDVISNGYTHYYGRACGAVVSTLYRHDEVLGSIAGQGEIYMENPVSAACPAHIAVMSRPGLYLVKGKVARSDWPSPS